jgi:peptidoglycan/LPS O-acetylase OafA/YrhL
MRLLVFAYCIVLAGAGVVTHSGFAMVAALTAGVLTVAGLMGKMHTWLSWPWIRSLGLISYSLYLLHNPITGASFRAVRLVLHDGLFADVVGMMIVLAACLGVSWIAFLIVERPSIVWSHSISLRAHQRHPRQSLATL